MNMLAKLEADYMNIKNTNNIKSARLLIFQDVLLMIKKAFSHRSKVENRAPNLNNEWGCFKAGAELIFRI